MNSDIMSYVWSPGHVGVGVSVNVRPECVRHLYARRLCFQALPFKQSKMLSAVRKDDERRRPKASKFPTRCWLLLPIELIELLKH